MYLCSNQQGISGSVEFCIAENVLFKIMESRIYLLYSPFFRSSIYYIIKILHNIDFPYLFFPEVDVDVSKNSIATGTSTSIR